MRRAALALCATLLVLHGCAKPAPAERQFPLTGTVVSLAADRAEITIAHDEVPGVMGAMTMAFTVKDRADLNRLAAGDAVAATLVVTNEAFYLVGLKKAAPPPPH